MFKMKRVFKRRVLLNPARWIAAGAATLLFGIGIVFYLGFTGSHKVCPWALVEVPLLMLRTGVGVFFLGGIVAGVVVILLSLWRPRFFCGWVCPLGFISEILGLLGEKLGLAAKPVPNWLNEKMRIFSYGVVILLVALTLARGTLACAYFCPIFWLCAAWKISVPATAIIGLALWLVLSLRVRRGFCRYVCPVGALTGFVSKFSRQSVVLNIEVCTNCHLCSKSCPMEIDVENAGFVVKSPHCISCGDCIKSCPFNALSWGKRSG